MKRKDVMGTVAFATLVVAATSPAASAWPGRPVSPPPKAPNRGAPPPAWIETQAKSTWLSYGSYCWTSGGQAACVDMLPPGSRPDLPLIRVGRGGALRVHLALNRPTVTVTVAGKRAAVRVDRTRGIVSWSARAGGLVAVQVHASGGSASYVARLRVS